MKVLLLILLLASTAQAQTLDTSKTSNPEIISRVASSFRTEPVTYLYGTPFIECGMFQAPYMLFGLILWSDQVPLLKDAGITLYTNNYFLGNYADMFNHRIDLKALSFGINIGVNTTFSLVKL